MSASDHRAMTVGPGRPGAAPSAAVPSGGPPSGTTTGPAVTRTSAEAGPAHRDHHERGIWRGTFVVYNLGVLGAGLAVIGALPLAALVLTQGSLLGLLLTPVLTWVVGTLLIAAVHAVHGQDLTTDIRPLRRLARGIRQSLRQAAALWLPVGVVAALVLAASALQGHAGPDLPSLALLGALTVVALIGSVIAARFTAGGGALWRCALGAVGVSGRGVLGILLVAVACLLLVTVIGEWVLLFAAAPLAALLDRSAAPLLDALERRGADG